MPPTEACPQCNARVPAGARFCQVCGAHMTGAAHKRKHKRPGRSRTKTWLAIGIVLVMLVGVVVIASGQLGAGSASAAVATTENIKAMEGMAGAMPAWLSSASKEVLTEYAWAAGHHDVLQYFPCYCGCFDNAGHDSNSECYFQRDGGGQITGYDKHAYG